MSAVARGSPRTIGHWNYLRSIADIQGNVRDGCEVKGGRARFTHWNGAIRMVYAAVAFALIFDAIKLKSSPVICYGVTDYYIVFLQDSQQCDIF